MSSSSQQSSQVVGNYRESVCDIDNPLMLKEGLPAPKRRAPEGTPEFEWECCKKHLQALGKRLRVLRGKISPVKRTAQAVQALHDLAPRSAPKISDHPGIQRNAWSSRKIFERKGNIWDTGDLLHLFHAFSSLIFLSCITALIRHH
ncbi:hypothetical protein N431DRAFT_443535 [Stipitochalara longipes BDJ]|nr:hypothetical protein N431DRAFT_443535 [Stipitochalara longipes BDJ]